MKALLLALSLGVAATASAEEDFSPVAQLHKFGMVGKYAVTCQNTPGEFYVIYAPDDDFTVELGFVGEESRNFQLGAALIGDDDHVKILIFADRVPMNQIIKKYPDGSIQMMSASNMDDTAFAVRDGINLKTRQPTERLKRCSG